MMVRGTKTHKKQSGLKKGGVNTVVRGTKKKTKSGVYKMVRGTKKRV
jgi:hypothetical protein